MIELLFLVLLVIVGLALGNKVLPLFRQSIDCFMEEQLIALGLGFGGLIIAVYILGATQLLSSSSILVLLFLSLWVGRQSILDAAIRSKTGIKTDRFSFDRWTWAFLLVLFVMMVFNLFGALAPTTDTDGLAYHLAVPQYYLDHGGFTYNPIMVFNWPASIEMLYTIALAVSTDSLAKLIHFLFGLMSALTVYILTKEWFGKDAGLIAAILFYAMPLVGLESGIAYVDLGTTFYIVMGTHLFMRWYLRQQEKTQPGIGLLSLAGIFVGIGASTKWNGPVSIFILLATAIIDALFLRSAPKKSSNSTRFVGPLVIFLLIASSFSLLWYAKNFALTGNPVAPFLGDRIATHDWGAENTKAYQSSVASLYLSPLNFIFIPWAITMHGQPFGELTYLGPWFLMLIPLCLLLFPWPRATSFIIVSSGMAYTVWFLTSQQSRLLLPTLAVLCAICGWIITHLRFARLRRIILISLLLSVILALPFTMLYNGKGAKVALGVENRQTYLERLLPDAAAIYWANLNLPATSKLLLVRENNAYLLRRDYLWGDTAMQGIIDYSTLEAPTLLERLKTNSITHVMVNRAIICADPRFESTHCPDIKKLLNDPLTKEHLTLIHEQNKVSIYSVS